MPRKLRVALGASIAVVALIAPAVASAAPAVAITGPFGDGHAFQSGNVSYTFNATDDGTPFVTCTLHQPSSPDIVTSSCSSPAAYSGLTDEGLYTLTVVDDNTVDPPVSDSVTFYVDLTDPTGSFATGPANNFVYSANPLSVGYTFNVSDPNGAPPLDIECTVSGQLSDGPNPCTNSYSVDTSLSGDGDYTLTVDATDGSGRTMTPLTRSFTVDTTPPSYTTLPAMTPEHDTGFTNSATPTFSWATTDLTTVTYQCWIDSDLPVACNGGTFTPGSALSEAGHTFNVTATDAAGNTNTKTKSFTVDTTAPTFSFGALGTHGASNFATPLTAVSLTVTPSETLDGGGATCDDGVTGPVACNTTFSDAGPLSDGEYTLDVSGTDEAGNAGTGEQKLFVDTVAPDAPSITTEPPLFTNDDTPDFAYTPSDPSPSSASGGYGSLTDQCDIGSGFGSCTTSPTFGPLSDGAYTFDVKTTDPAGNTGPPSAYSFTVDTVAPTVDTFDVTPHGHVVTDTNSATPHFTFTGHDLNGVASMTCWIDSGPTSDCSGGTYDATTLAEGDHTLHVLAKDAATNQSTTDFAFAVDLTDPIPSTTVHDGDDYVLHQAKSITCTDPLSNSYASGIFTCDAFVDGVDVGTGYGLPTHSADLGYHSFSATATDNAANTASTGTVHYVVNAGPYADVVNSFAPAGFWPGNDGLTSTTMADGSVHSDDGKWTPGVAHGRTGPAVDLDVNAGATATELSGTGGSYGYVTGIDAGPRAYTMDIWVKSFDTGQQSVYGHGAGAGEIYIDSSGHFAFHHPGVTVTASGTAIQTGDWYHLMATWGRASSSSPGTATLRVEGFDGSMSSLGTETQSGTSSQDASGAAALYIGNGELGANHTFHGLVADAAYFTQTLGSHEFIDLSKAMTWTYHPIRANPTDWTPPTIVINSPTDGDGFQTSKAGGFHVSWSCDDFEGSGDVTQCDGDIDGNPVNQGDSLSGLLPGSHTFTVTAADDQGPVTKSVTFYVGTYSDVIAQDSPLAYWRLDEAGTASTMADSSGNGHSGDFKWDLSDPAATANGGTGISGDGDTTRSFFGTGAYAYVNGLAVSPVGLTEEAWVEVSDPARDQVFMEHGGAGVLYVRGGLYRFKPNANHTVELTGPAPSNGSFDHVVGTWDGVNATLYVNGVAVDSAMSIDPPPSGVATLYLGRTDGTLGAFHGTLDEAAYYDYALSAHRVLLHYRADPPAGAAAAAPKIAAPASSGGAHSTSHKSAKAKAAAKKKALVKALTRSVAKAKAKLKLLVRHHATKRRITAQRKALARLQHRLRRLKG